MKIAIVTYRFPVISETFVIDHVTGLLDRGHEVSVYAFEPGEEGRMHTAVSRYALREKTTYFALPPGRRMLVRRAVRAAWRALVTDPRALLMCLFRMRYKNLYAALSTLIKLEPFLGKGYDVVHGHFGHIAEEMIFLKKVFPRMKVVVTFHWCDLRAAKEGTRAYLRTFALADTVIAICRYNYDALKALGCPPEKLVLVPNGIDTACFCRQSPALAGGGTVRILSVGRLVPAKGFLFALEAIERLSQAKGTAVRYDIIGDGGMRRDIEEAIRARALEGVVTLRGALTREEVVSALAETDVFFLPSREESFPTVLLEAHAAGIPAVATAVGGVSEIVQEGVSGFIVAYGDTETAARRLRELIDDRSLRARMGEGAQRRVRDCYSLSRAIMKQEEVYAGRR